MQQTNCGDCLARIIERNGLLNERKFDFVKDGRAVDWKRERHLHNVATVIDDI